MSNPDTASGYTIAVTGPTGTFGYGLIPRLQEDERVDRVVGIARRPFDPAVRGWSKMEYRRGDVRDPAALGAAFEGADAVIHLAFLVIGNAPRAILRRVNVGGTLNAFRAAAETRPRKHRGRPVGSPPINNQDCNLNYHDQGFQYQNKPSSLLLKSQTPWFYSVHDFRVLLSVMLRLHVHIVNVFSRDIFELQEKEKVNAHSWPPRHWARNGNGSNLPARPRTHSIRTWHRFDLNLPL